MTDTEKTEQPTEQQASPEEPTEKLVILHAPGSIPGIPGEHGPGGYLVDYAARTIRPLPDAEVPGPKASQKAKPLSNSNK